MKARLVIYGGVVLCLLILGSIACPSTGHPNVKAREQVLREDLEIMRQSIRGFRQEYGRHPECLQELVTEGYIRHVPADPLTRSTETWITAQEDSGGISYVWSGAGARATDGTWYRDW